MTGLTHPPPTVNFSMRGLRSDLRDRLHALAAIREAKTKTKVTLESVVNEALALGVATLEAEWYGPALAAKIAAPKEPPLPEVVP